MFASSHESTGHDTRKVLSRLRMRPKASSLFHRQGTFERRNAIKQCDRPETFDTRLREAITSLETQIFFQVEDWHRARQDDDAPCDIFLAEVAAEADTEDSENHVCPRTCFDDFIADVTTIMNSYYDDYCRELEMQFYKDLTRHTAKNLHEVIGLRDRLAPWLRAIDLTCTEEDLLLYKPLERWSIEQQEVMTEMIEERLRQLLTLEQLRSTRKEQPESDKGDEVASQSQTEEDAEKEEEARQRAKSARDHALAASKEITKNLENECDELERLLEEMRARLKRAEKRGNQIRKRTNSLSAASDELDKPLPPVENTQDHGGKSFLGGATKAENGTLRLGQNEQHDEKMIASEVLAANKAAFDAEFERCKKEALDTNAEKWKHELQAFLARIAELEEELSLLTRKKEQAIRAAVQSRASTEVPPEFSQTSGAASPIASSSMHHDPVKNWNMLRQKVNAFGTTGSVFEKLYQDSDVRRVRVEETRERRSIFVQDQFARTFVRHRPFGSMVGHEGDSLKYVSNSAAYSPPGAKDWARRSLAPSEFGSSLSKLKIAQSEPQLRVCLCGPLPRFDEWCDSVPATRASTPQLGSRELSRTTNAKVAEGWTSIEAPPQSSGQGLLQLAHLSTWERSGRNKGMKSQKKVPYDILKPTLQQVEAHAKLPTALSRMVVEEDLSEEDAQADTQAEKDVEDEEDDEDDFAEMEGGQEEKQQDQGADVTR